MEQAIHRKADEDSKTEDDTTGGRDESNQANYMSKTGYIPSDKINDKWSNKECYGVGGKKRGRRGNKTLIR